MGDLAFSLTPNHLLDLPRAKTRGLLHHSTRVEKSVGPGSAAGEVRWWGMDVPTRSVAPPSEERPANPQNNKARAMHGPLSFSLYQHAYCV